MASPPTKASRRVTGGSGGAMSSYALLAALSERRYEPSLHYHCCVEMICVGSFFMDVFLML